MTSTIQLLSDQIINQIAAGEVIENPASVVKELVENAVDAGAKNIRISIKGGGLQLIRIEDDGSGMNLEDLKMSICRHATSKLVSLQDLEEILTMGFRGEALASVASISKMIMESAKDNQAYQVHVENGSVVLQEPTYRKTGTTVEVKSLFYNVPARKKFQKSQTANLSQIHKAAVQLALAYPHVGLKLVSHDTDLLDLQPQEGSFLSAFIQRAQSIYKQEIAEHLLTIDYQEGPFHLQGAIGFPSFSKKTRLYQQLFVNNRCVQSHMISQMVKEGYGTRIQEQVYPVFFLHLFMPGLLLDVNVHPQKKEVRFREEAYLRQFFIKAVSQSLQKALPCSFSINEKVFESKPAFSVSSSYEPSLAIMDPAQVQMQMFEEPFEKKEKIQIYEIAKNYAFVNGKTMPARLFLEQNEDKSGMIIIDLHAAYARCVFERFAHFFEKREAIVSQDLAFPLQISVRPEDRKYLEKQSGVLQNMGISFRFLQDNLLVVDSIPTTFDEKNFEELFLQILEDIIQFSKSRIAKQTFNRKLAQNICRFSRTSKTGFSIYEAEKILDELLNCDDPYRDPLGRATMVLMDKKRLEKIFT